MSVSILAFINYGLSWMVILSWHFFILAQGFFLAQAHLNVLLNSTAKYPRRDYRENLDVRGDRAKCGSGGGFDLCRRRALELSTQEVDFLLRWGEMK